MKTVRPILFMMLLLLVRPSAQAQNLDSVLARLASTSATERIAALRQLAKMDANIRALEPLTNALSDTSPDVRREALTTWGSRGEDYSIVMSKSLRRKNRGQNEQRWELLGELRNWQKTLAARLEERTEDVSPEVRSEAIRTLIRLDISFETVFPPYSSLGRCGTVEYLSLDSIVSEGLYRIAEKSPTSLFAFARERDAQFAYSVTRRLAFSDFPEVISLLKHFVQGVDPVWRMIGCVGLIYCEDANRYIVPLLSDVDDRVRECAVHYLRDTEKMLPGLAKSFRHSSVPLRRSIVKMVEELREEDKAAYAFLIREACRDRDGDVLADALTIVEDSPVKLPFAYVRGLLKHPHPRVRAEAARRLASYEDKPTFEPLLPLLRDPNENVRDTLIELLCSEEDPRLPEEIVAAFRKSRGDADYFVGLALDKNLRYAKPLALQMLQDREARLRAVAVRAIGAGKRLEDLPLLSKAATDKSPRVREAVANAFGGYNSPWLKDTRVVGILLELLDNKDSEVRIHALFALRFVDSRQVRERLSQLVQEPDERLAEAAQMYLDEQQDKK